MDVLDQIFADDASGNSPDLYAVPLRCEPTVFRCPRGGITECLHLVTSPPAFNLAHATIIPHAYALYHHTRARRGRITTAIINRRRVSHGRFAEFVASSAAGRYGGSPCLMPPSMKWFDFTENLAAGDGAIERWNQTPHSVLKADEMWRPVFIWDIILRLADPSQGRDLHFERRGRLWPAPPALEMRLRVCVFECFEKRIALK